MFSSRLPAALGPNPFSRAIVRHRTAGTPLLDLTITNPTDVGIVYPPDLLAPLAERDGLRYEPAPLGLRGAREAISAEYVRDRLFVSADRILLTASTSEAYALLFKLLCDPGDAVAIPQPSYPLFDLLTQLESIVT